MTKIAYLLALLFCFSCRGKKNDSSEKISNDHVIKEMTMQSIDTNHVKVYPQLIELDTLPPLNYEQYLNNLNCDQLGQTKLNFKDFWMIIDAEFSVIESKTQDTLSITEDVGEYIAGRRIQLRSHDEQDEFKMYLCAYERVSEQYNRTKIAEGSSTPEEYFKKEKAWYKNSVHWEGYSDYEFVKPDTNYLCYRIPYLNGYNGYFEQKRKKIMNANDTIVDLSSEADNIATMAYKGVPCNYMLDYYTLKIIHKKKNGQENLQYIKIYLSYGC